MLLPAFERGRNSNAQASSASVCVLLCLSRSTFLRFAKMHNDWTDYFLDVTLVAFELVIVLPIPWYVFEGVSTVRHMMIDRSFSVMVFFFLPHPSYMYRVPDSDAANGHLQGTIV